MAAKASILRAAAAVYNRTGEDAPVEEILKEAEISRAHFYKHFSSKEALQEALLEFATKTVLAAVEDAVRGCDDDGDRLDAGIRAFLSFHAHQPGVYRVLLSCALTPGTKLHQIRARALDRFASLFADEVVRAGRVPADPFVYRALVAAVEGTSIRILRGQGQVDPSVLERARAALQRIVAATLAQDGDPVPPLPRPPEMPC